VVCLAPRARADSVRPRRRSGVVGRPLNFAVRALMFRPRLILVALPPAAIWAAFVYLDLQRQPPGFLVFVGLSLAGYSLTVPALVYALRFKSNEERLPDGLNYVAWLGRGFLTGLLAITVFFIVTAPLAFAGIGPSNRLDGLVIWLAIALFVCYSSAKRVQ
jgi:hypothetical protein